MKHRKLRIAWSVAWSVAWAVVAVLLIALWVRSYSHWDVIQRGRKIVLVAIDSEYGELRFAKHVPFYDFGGDFYFISNNLDNRTFSNKAFYFSFGSGNIFAGVPHWFAAGLFSLVAVIPWIHWSNRFTLRTLLIATTLVGVGLGLIVWLR